MSVLFFLPWVKTVDPIKLGSMQLIPYIRCLAPGTLHGISQKTIDSVLGSYGDPSYSPSQNTNSHITNSTIITWSDDAEGLEVSDDQITVRLEQANYIAFAALSKRRFCSHTDYCNSDGYQTVAQRFTEHRPGGTTIVTRRRDGQGQHYVGAAPAPRFIRPYHVNGNLSLAIDVALASALSALPDGNLKCRIDAAIEAFLRANTDSPVMREQSEMVLMRVAFETILDSTHETSHLRKRVSDHFKNDLPVPAVWATGSLNETHWRNRWPANVERPLDAWVQDFCSARNAAAHRPCDTRKPTVWQQHNHLLLSSWLFPLMVKKALEAEGLYQLIEEDLVARRNFESFFAHDLLSYSDKNERKLWWTRVESEILEARIFSQLGESQ